jgi:hypothetical protein
VSTLHFPRSSVRLQSERPLSSPCKRSEEPRCT